MDTEERTEAEVERIGRIFEERVTSGIGVCRLRGEGFGLGRADSVSTSVSREPAAQKLTYLVRWKSRYE